MDRSRDAMKYSGSGYHPRVAEPTFPRRDPADREFWELRYGARFLPWDAGKVPAQLLAFVRASAGPRRVLVPGCGSAWDVRCFAEHGWDVLGIDFSAAAVEEARTVLGPHAGHVREADFFAPIPEAPFNVVYERAFLCALPRRLWSDWARRASELVRPGGDMAGFFYFGEGQRGPPFPLHSQAELEALIGGAFERIEDAPVEDSIPVFRGKERWQVWRRHSGAAPKSSD
ncbi:MAG TPA: methyltransferase domain-containing protein [Usitatibacter sp.]|nr:methyltransferase domain-containing protein [Usitatibacter sp.]